MSDELERRLKEFPAHFPRPDEKATRRLEERVAARLRSRRRPRRARRVALAAAVAIAAASATAAVTIATAASDRVTLFVQPPVIPGTNRGAAIVFGTVSNERAGEKVTIEIKECGQSNFRALKLFDSQGTTSSGGAYSASVSFAMNTIVRARWRDAVSPEVSVRRRSTVTLQRRPNGQFWVAVWAQHWFDGRRVRVERWNPRRARWLLVREVVLKRGFAREVIVSERELRLRVPRRTLLRAVLPAAQARPCYAEGTSQLLRA